VNLFGSFKTRTCVSRSRPFPSSFPSPPIPLSSYALQILTERFDVTKRCSWQVLSPPLKVSGKHKLWHISPEQASISRGLCPQNTKLSQVTLSLHHFSFSFLLACRCELLLPLSSPSTRNLDVTIKSTHGEVGSLLIYGTRKK
jgi:hypothetical protein